MAGGTAPHTPPAIEPSCELSGAPHYGLHDTLTHAAVKSRFERAAAPRHRSYSPRPSFHGIPNALVLRRRTSTRPCRPSRTPGCVDVDRASAAPSRCSAVTRSPPRASLPRIALCRRSAEAWAVMSDVGRRVRAAGPACTVVGLVARVAGRGKAGLRGHDCCCQAGKPPRARGGGAPGSCTR